MAIIDLNLAAFGHAISQLQLNQLRITSATGLNVDAQYTAVIKALNTSQRFWFGPLHHGLATAVIPTYTADGQHMASFVVIFTGELPNLFDSVIKITG